MKSRSPMSIFFLLIFTLMLGACGLDLGGAMPDPDLDDAESENDEPSEERLQQLSGEDTIDIYFRYLMNDPHLKFKVDMPLLIDFVETDREGKFNVAGIFIDWDTSRMTKS